MRSPPFNALRSKVQIRKFEVQSSKRKKQVCIGGIHMATMVNTVLGKVNADTLGKTLMHEHFLFGSPGFEGDSTLAGLNWDKAMTACLEAAEKLKKHGVKTVIDATFNDCGRNPLFLKELSEKSGLQILCTTGYSEEPNATPYVRKFVNKPGLAEQAFYDMFMAEITDGIAGTGIKAGVIKVGSSSGIISGYEKPFFKAAARAQNKTDIVIITHTTDGTMGPEQAELLISEGANPQRIIIGHMCGANLTSQLKTLKQGVNLGLDRFGLDGVGAPPDEVRIAALIGLVALGYGSRLALSHDSVVYWQGRQPQPQIKTWYTGHLFDDVVPVLQKSLTDQQINALFEDAIKHAFAD
jgi:phosphotriesterase-related protein